MLNEPEKLKVMLSFSCKLNRSLISILCVIFLLASIGFVAGFFLGYESVKTRQRILRVLVNNPISRFFILKNTSSLSSVAKDRVAKSRSDLKEVACPTDHLAVASFGQSNAANRVLRSEGLTAINDGKTFMWDWTTEKCYPYSEAVVGTDGSRGGNILTETIVQLRSEYSGNLLIIAFARGGSSIFDWSHVRLSVRLDTVLYRLREHAIYPKVFLWHQGESDAIPEVYVPWKVNAYGHKKGSVSYHYGSALSLITQKIHGYFPKSIIGVALVSICNNNGSPSIVSAQKRVAEKYAYVKVSSNTDMLGDEYRQDGCHFNELGAAKIGKDYALLIKQQLEKAEH